MCKENMKGDCKNCDWFNNKIKECASPTSCKEFNEYFKDENKDNLLKEGDFYYSFL